MKEKEKILVKRLNPKSSKRREAFPGKFGYHIKEFFDISEGFFHFPLWLCFPDKKDDSEKIVNY